MIRKQAKLIMGPCACIDIVPVIKCPRSWAEGAQRPEEEKMPWNCESIDFAGVPAMWGVAPMDARPVALRPDLERVRHLSDARRDRRRIQA